jgi:hypothetical protein
MGVWQVINNAIQNEAKLPWRRERRKAQKLLNRSEKKLQAKNTPQGGLKDQRGRAVNVGRRCRIFE